MCCNVCQITSKAFWKKVIPSKSSMVFSSLATVLSANSARVSACVTHTDLWVSTCDASLQRCINHPGLQTQDSWLASFSLSVRTLISSSYLSSFCEYYGKQEEHTSDSPHAKWKKIKLKWTDRVFSGSSGSHPLEGLEEGVVIRQLVLPSQLGPPVTSGCWSQFSTLPQAQSICWGGGVKTRGKDCQGE